MARDALYVLVMSLMATGSLAGEYVIVGILMRPKEIMV